MFRLPYGTIFGGVTALKAEHFEQMNGYSNDYWGWGGEDDDMRSRYYSNLYKILTFPLRNIFYAA